MAGADHPGGRPGRAGRARAAVAAVVAAGDGGAVSADALPPAVAAALAEAGVAPGANGHDAPGLLAAAEAMGLAISVEEIPGESRFTPPREQRYRALVRPRDGGVGWSARGRGRTEAEALAAALLKWLRRHPGGAGDGG